MKLLLICLAGTAGTLLRYTCVSVMNRTSLPFPTGTLAVNTVGAFLAGFLFILCKERFAEYQEYFPVLFIGFLGAFTTFSTYTLDSMKLLLAGNSGMFCLNILLQNGLGLLAAFGGIRLAESLMS